MSGRASTPLDGAADRRRGLRRLSLRGLVRNVSLASWLTVVVLTVTILSILAVSVVGLGHITNLSGSIVESRIGALRSLRVSEVEKYLNTTMSQVRALAESPTTVEAVIEFTDAFRELNALDPGGAAADGVSAYYRDVFVPGLKDTSGSAVPWQDLVPTGNAAVHLQYHYVVPVEPGSGSVIDDAGDGSRWSEIHRESHAQFVDLAGRLGFEDLYLVEPSAGTVVYSAAKAPDFATSLDRGPYSASALASHARAVRADPRPGAVTVADFAPYPPALGRPVGFLGSPIFEGQRFAGILVVRIPLDRLNAIMTAGGDWASEGLQETGETYLVGIDGRMRSVSRMFVEDPEAYFAGVEAARSMSESEIAAVRALETTVVFQKAADLDTLQENASGSRGLYETRNYLGREVLSSYEPIRADGFDWFVTVEVEREEVEEPLVRFRRNTLLVVSIFVLAITFLAVAWARGALEPVRAISERLRRTLEGEPSVEEGPPTGGPMEMGALHDDIERMTAMAEQRQAELERAADERIETLRGLLPPMIAERLEAGDRLVVEKVLQSSVVVLVLDGLGELIRGEDVARTREALDRIVDTLDSLAGDHGLERIKVVGDVYFAGCGLSHPYLDHAPRALGFAFDAISRLDEESRDLPQPLIPATGVHSGPVSVGLAGSSRLLYDVWGESLSVTYRLAQRARPGEVLVSEETREFLPPEYTVQPRDDGGEPAAWLVSRTAPNGSEANRG